MLAGDLHRPSFVLRERHQTVLRLAAILTAVMITSAPPVRAQATGSIVGRVLDQTGGVLPGVIIDLLVGAAELTVVTDDEGRYRFEPVPGGTAELRFRRLNFGVLRRTLSVDPGTSVTADAVLALSLNADVVVTGTATFRNIVDIDNPAENLVGIAAAANAAISSSRPSAGRQSEVA